jgi:poly(3-hydroxybutyrate) depolymerase
MPGLFRRTVHWTCAAIWILAVALCGMARSEDALPAGFHERLFRDASGEHKYLVFLPPQYTPETRWPVILYLHGASARGSDNRLPIIDGLGPHIRARAADFPFIVVFPQCEDVEARHLEGWLAETPDAKRALRILDQVESEFNIDRGHEILTGLSMGACGAWSVACATPTRWAAVLIISGTGNPADAHKLKDVPIWAFHGEKDLALPIEGDRRMVDAVRAAGGHPHLTVLPGARHIIAHVVYSDDAVFDWMLNPKSEPRQDNIVTNSERKPTPAELGFDINTSFVPAAEIPQAAYIHVGKDAIDALAAASIEMLPANALAGSVAGVHRGGRAMGMSFQMDVAGMNYRGELERLIVECRPDGWAVLRVGLRHLTLEVPQAQLNGRLFSATAGPMYVEIGTSRAVWLSVPLRPHVDAGQIHFEAGNPRFQISADDFHVSTPKVEGHGLPILRREVSSRLQEKMVSGAYEKKAEVEKLVLRSVPRMLEQLETRLNHELLVPRTIGSWPMPSLQPRFTVWASDAQIDESGLNLIVGMTISRPGLNPPKGVVRKIEGRKLNFEDIPKTSGLQVGISGGMIEGITAALIAAGANGSDLLDLNPAGFAPFEDPQRMAKMIPDLARFGDGLKVRTLAQIIEPIAMTAARHDAATSESLDLPRGNAQLDNTFAFNLPKVRLLVEIKATPEQTTWQPCAEIDVTLRQRLRMDLLKPNFVQRLVDIQAVGTADVSAEARFAPGYESKEFRLETELIGKTFAEGWKSGGQMQLMRGMEARDLVLGQARLRAVDTKWLDPFSVRFFEPAHTGIKNSTSEPIEYLTRSHASGWGGPYRLKPGQTDEFNISEALTVLYRTAKGEFTETIPVGERFEISPMQDSLTQRPPEAQNSGQ